MSFSSDAKDTSQIYNDMMPDYNKSKDFSQHEGPNGKPNIYIESQEDLIDENENKYDQYQDNRKRYKKKNK